MSSKESSALPQATKFFGLKGVAEPSSVLVSKYKETDTSKRGI